MNDYPQPNPHQLSEAESAQLLQTLLYKQGTWVDWGKACQQLQKAGYTPQLIFEQTGFQGSQQNLIIVAAQVYESLVQEGASAETLTYFQGPRSDVLYEFRILNQQQRLSVAEVAKEKKLDVDEAKDLAKAVQTFSRFAQLPPEFTHHPGDTVAYQCWKQAKQKKDLVERTRLIAKGLKFAHSAGAREAIERLLSDFKPVSTVTAPLLPLHRLEEEDELARLIPFVGDFSVSAKNIKEIQPLVPQEPFNIVEYNGKGAIVPLPGWQAVLKATNPIAILWPSGQLPITLAGKPQPVLVVVDLAVQTWDINSYFLIEDHDNLSIQWFEDLPDVPLLGQVIVVLRPKKIFDENNIVEPWQMDD